MMPRYLLPLAILLASGLLMALLWWPDAAASNGPPAVQQTSADAGAGTTDAQAPPPPFGAREKAAPTVPMTREELTESPIAAPVQEGMVISVLDWQENPVPHADVWIRDLPLPEVLQVLQDYPLPWRPFLDHLRLSATRYRTGADGKVTVPYTMHHATVLAESLDMIGFLNEAVNHISGAVVHIWPVEEFPVLVRDQEGSPVADALVILRRLKDPKPLAYRRTDRRGMATFDMPSALRMQDAFSTDLAVDLGLFGGPSQRIDLPFGVAPEAQNILIMPDTGMLQVQITEADGEPLQQMVQLTVDLLDGNADGKAYWPPSEHWDLPITPEMLPFLLPVGSFGGSIKVAAASSDGLRHAKAIEMLPSGVGNTRGIYLRLETDRTQVVFRLRNEAGKIGKRVLAHLGIREAAAAGKVVDLYENRADQEGRITVDLGYDRLAKSPLFLVVMMPARGKQELRLIELPLPQPLLPGIHDLGDATLAPAPILLEGDVVDHEGRGVQGAMLELSRQDPTAHDGWNRETLWTTSTDREGHFRLRGIASGGRFRVKVQASGFGVIVRKANMGDRRAQFAMVQDQIIQGQVLADSGILARDLRLGLSFPLPGGESSSRVRRTVRLEQDFSFHFRAAPTEGAILSVFADDSGEALWEQHLLELPRDGSEVSIGDIDLRGRLHLYKIQLATDDGANLFGATVILPGGRLIHPDGSPMRLLMRPDRIHVRLSATGYLAEESDLLPGDNRVSLERGREVTLLVPDLAGLPVAKRPTLHLAEIYRDMSDRQFPVKLDEMGMATLYLNGPAIYRVQWRNPVDSRGTLVMVLGDDEGGTIEVSEAPVQSIHLNLPPKQ